MTGDPGSEAFIDDGQGDVIALPGFATDPAGILRRRWKAMLAVIVLGLAGCAAFVYTQEPSFTSRATVMVSSQRISEQFVRSLQAHSHGGIGDTVACRDLSRGQPVEIAM